MGRPQRLDNPKKITLSLAAACHEQMADLAAALSTGRQEMSRSEVVERAVALLHGQTTGPKNVTPAKPRRRS